MYKQMCRKYDAYSLEFKHNKQLEQFVAIVDINQTTVGDNCMTWATFWTVSSQLCGILRLTPNNTKG